MKGEGHSILLYSKEDCCLCAEVKEMLQRLAAKYPLTIREIDITGDPVLYERYRWAVPVVKIDGGKVLGGRFREEELCTLLLEMEEGE